MGQQSIGSTGGLRSIEYLLNRWMPFQRQITTSPARNAPIINFKDLDLLSSPKVPGSTWYDAFIAATGPGHGPPPYIFAPQAYKWALSATPVLHGDHFPLDAQAILGFQTRAALEGYFDKDSKSPDVIRLLNDMGANHNDFWRKSVLGKSLAISAIHAEKNEELKAKIASLEHQIKVLQQEVKNLKAANESSPPRPRSASTIDFREVIKSEEQCNIWVEELKPYFERFANLTKEVTEINYLPCSEEHKDELFYYALAQLTYGRRLGQKRLFNFHSFCKGFLGREELKTKLRETFDNNASIKRIFVHVCKTSLVNHMEDVSKSIISSGVPIRKFDKVCHALGRSMCPSVKALCARNREYKRMIEDELGVFLMENGSGLDLERTVELIHDDNAEVFKDAENLYLHIIFDGCRITQTGKYQVYFCAILSPTEDITDPSMLTKAKRQYSFCVIDGHDTIENIDANFIKVYAPFLAVFLKGSDGEITPGIHIFEGRAKFGRQRSRNGEVPHRIIHVIGVIRSDMSGSWKIMNHGGLHDPIGACFLCDQPSCQRHIYYELVVVDSDIAWDDIPTRFQMHQDTFAMVNGLRKVDGNVLNLEQYDNLDSLGIDVENVVICSMHMVFRVSIAFVLYVCNTAKENKTFPVVQRMLAEINIHVKDSRSFAMHDMPQLIGESTKRFLKAFPDLIVAARAKNADLWKDLCEKWASIVSSVLQTDIKKMSQTEIDSFAMRCNDFLARYVLLTDRLEYCRGIYLHFLAVGHVTDQFKKFAEKKIPLGLLNMSAMEKRHLEDKSKFLLLMRLTVQVC
ncbi:hypothetical protein GUITHDRAFT_149210 [Guillardia theta CCMP2712]|uniref:Uncharacterized protein n=1 Tax=Guillardia theta (strain CCMP2712) TaxID=905079 RepID=L1I6S8_GUITC|nr:hypothetical protein GUITHDRAFT_149210 [Guillardia theta CCMP2712]EKX31575.1 hypothetical protein GUITHDRAFT_149210 [Guillardia theta CCMP2712]|eukprot:XP_005818555.1 hypothetical protein GUITHDRAFT_149210 [Guillardia theta CCMP2712]